LAHRQDPLIEINLADTEVQDLSKTETTAIQQAKNFGHGEVAQWCTRRGNELIDRLKELSHLVPRQNARGKLCAISPCQCRIRDIRRIAQPTQKRGELAHDSDPLLMGARTLVDLLGEPLLGEGAG